jgi:hypothetical protein
MHKSIKPKPVSFIYLQALTAALALLYIFLFCIINLDYSFEELEFIFVVLTERKEDQQYI